MTTETNTAQLTEKEANKIFREAYSDIHKSQGRITNNYDAPSYEEPDKPAVVQEVTPSTLEPTPTPTPAAPAEPAATPPAAAAPTPAAPSAPAQKPIEELIKELPGEAQQFIQKIMSERDLADQRYRTTSGRLYKTRQEYMERQRELMDLRTRVSQPPSAVDQQAKIDHAKSLEEWQAVIQAEPTLAKAVDALTDAKVGAVKDQLTQLQTQLSARENAQTEEQRELTRQQEWDKLTQIVPNVQDVLLSKEYKYWISNVAPPAVQKMAAESNDHQDALFVLSSYHPYAVALAEQMNKQNAPAAPSAPVTPPANPPAPTRADEIANQRQNKPLTPVSSSVPPINLSAGGELNMKDQSSIDAYFLQAYEKAKKR